MLIQNLVIVILVTLNMFITMKTWAIFSIHIEGPIWRYKVLLERRQRVASLTGPRVTPGTQAGDDAVFSHQGKKGSYEEISVQNPASSDMNWFVYQLAGPR